MLKELLGHFDWAYHIASKQIILNQMFLLKNIFTTIRCCIVVGCVNFNYQQEKMFGQVIDRNNILKCVCVCESGREKKKNYFSQEMRSIRLSDPERYNFLIQFQILVLITCTCPQRTESSILLCIALLCSIDSKPVLTRTV